MCIQNEISTVLNSAPPIKALQTAPVLTLSRLLGLPGEVEIDLKKVSVWVTTQAYPDTKLRVMNFVDEGYEVAIPMNAETDKQIHLDWFEVKDCGWPVISRETFKAAEEETAHSLIDADQIDQMYANKAKRGGR